MLPVWWKVAWRLTIPECCVHESHGGKPRFFIPMMQYLKPKHECCRLPPSLPPSSPSPTLGHQKHHWNKWIQIRNAWSTEWLCPSIALAWKVPQRILHFHNLDPRYFLEYVHPKMALSYLYPLFAGGYPHSARISEKSILVVKCDAIHDHLHLDINEWAASSRDPQTPHMHTEYVNVFCVSFK